MCGTVRPSTACEGVVARVFTVSGSQPPGLDEAGHRSPRAAPTELAERPRQRALRRQLTARDEGVDDPGRVT